MLKIIKKRILLMQYYYFTCIIGMLLFIKFKWILLV